MNIRSDDELYVSTSVLRFLCSGSQTGVFCLILITLLFLATGCSQKGPLERLQGEPTYAGWEIYYHKNFKMLHPPDHLHKDYFEVTCEGYLKAAERIAKVLEIPPFTDTLYVVYYTGFRQGRELSGQRWPHVADGVIHFWQPAYAGVTLTDFLLPSWSSKNPTGHVVWHGLRALLDFSGRNYHAETQELLDNDEFIPLIDLAVDTNMLSDSERIQSGEAASLVAYILAAYGIPELKQLYESTVPFHEAVGKCLGTTVDTLQEDWLEYVRLSLPPDTASP